MHRVVTRRLQVTSNRTAALRGVECEESTLLLAKRIVQEARARDAASNPREAEKLQRAIGELTFASLRTFKNHLYLDAKVVIDTVFLGRAMNVVTMRCCTICRPAFIPRGCNIRGSL